MPKDKSTNKAQVWQQRYELAANNQEEMFQRFANWYDLMYAAINTKSYAPWRSKVFIPILASKAWNMVAKLLSLNPGFEVSIRNPEEGDDVQNKADKAQRKLEYDFDNPDFDEPMRDKQFSSLMDALVTGTGLAKVPWVSKQQVNYSRPIDEETGDVDMTKEIVKTKMSGHNDLVPVNIFNVFIAPSATNLYSAPWLLIREFKTYDELKEVNETSGVEIYKNLDSLKELKAQTDRFAQYKKSRNRLTTEEDPIVADTTLDQIEVFECYEKSSNKLYTFAVGRDDKGESQWVEIRCQGNPYWHRKYPLVAYYIRRRPYEFWGQGIFEDTERLQSATNDLFNHYLDNLNLSLDGMLMFEEGSTINGGDDYIIQPGGSLTYQGEKPEQFRFPTPDARALQLVMQELDSAIESVTISQYATGMPDSASDKTQGTATGIMRLQDAAGDLVGFLRQNFKTSIHQVGQMWLSNNQQFLSAPVTLTSHEDAQPKSVTISPQDLQGEMDLRIDDASMQPLSHEDQLRNYMAYQDNALKLQQGSIQQSQTAGTKPLVLNFAAMFEESSRQFQQKGFHKFVVSEEEMAAIAQQQAEEQQAQEEQAAVDEHIAQDAQAMTEQGLIGGDQHGPEGLPQGPEPAVPQY